MSIIALFTTQSRLITTLRNKPIEKIVGKGENADDLHFLLLARCLLPYQKTEIAILTRFNLTSANDFNLVLSKILSFGTESTLYSIDTHFNASTTDSFRKHCGKR